MQAFRNIQHIKIAGLGFKDIEAAQGTVPRHRDATSFP